MERSLTERWLSKDSGAAVKKSTTPIRFLFDFARSFGEDFQILSSLLSVKEEVVKVGVIDIQ